MQDLLPSEVPGTRTHGASNALEGHLADGDGMRFNFVFPWPFSGQLLDERRLSCLPASDQKQLQLRQRTRVDTRLEVVPEELSCILRLEKALGYSQRGVSPQTQPAEGGQSGQRLGKLFQLVVLQVERVKRSKCAQVRRQPPQEIFRQIDEEKMGKLANPRRQFANLVIRKGQKLQVF